jgi:flagellar protein FliS
MSQNAHDTYLESRILSADPIELIRMLYEAATRAVRDARRHLAAGDIAARARSITQASAVVIELATSLDHERGGKISADLARLYDYMLRRLTEANLQQSDRLLAEILGLLATLSEGWDGVKAQGVAAPPVRREEPLPTSAPKPAASNGGSWEQPAPQEAPTSYGGYWAQPAAQEAPATYGSSWDRPAAQEPSTSFGNSWDRPVAQEPERSYGSVWGQQASEEPAPTLGNSWNQPSEQTAAQEPAATSGSPWAQPAVQELAAAYGQSWAEPASPEPAANYGNAWSHLASQEPSGSYSPHDWSL